MYFAAVFGMETGVLFTQYCPDANGPTVSQCHEGRNGLFTVTHVSIFVRQIIITNALVEFIAKRPAILLLVECCSILS